MARWTESELVHAQITESAAVFGQVWPQMFRDYPELLAVCESPIEAAFVVWWKFLDVLRAAKSGALPRVRLAQQVEVVAAGRNYRLDFAVPECMVAIELDGHQFHERTKQQVAERNQRDLDLQNAGWIAIHISGSELVGDPIARLVSIEDTCMNRKRAAHVEQD